MIDVRIFQLKKLRHILWYFYTCICYFIENHQAHGDLEASTLSEHILLHNAYCCVVPESFTGRLSVRRFTFDAVNDNLPDIVELYGSNSRKITCDLYIDDKSIFIDSIGRL